MATLNARISKLEANEPDTDLVRLAIEALPPLLDGELAWNATDEGHSNYRAQLMNLGNEATARVRDSRLTDPADRGLANVLFDPQFARYPLALERYRERVPGPVLAAVYNAMRNYAFPPAIRMQVRQLAGVLDEHAVPHLGFIHIENGCVVTVPDATQPRPSVVLPEGRA